MYVYAFWLVVDMEVDALWLAVGMEVDALWRVVDMEVDVLWHVVDELRARSGTDTLVSSRPSPHFKRRQLVWMLRNTRKKMEIQVPGPNVNWRCT